MRYGRQPISRDTRGNHPTARTHASYSNNVYTLDTANLSALKKPSAFLRDKNLIRRTERNVTPAAPPSFNVHLYRGKQTTQSNVASAQGASRRIAQPRVIRRDKIRG
jgi:hypothetical protein